VAIQYSSLEADLVPLDLHATTTAIALLAAAQL
jgi:hypothetical protein